MLCRPRILLVLRLCIPVALYLLILVCHLRCTLVLCRRHNLVVPCLYIPAACQQHILVLYHMRTLVLRHLYTLVCHHLRILVLLTLCTLLLRQCILLLHHRCIPVRPHVILTLLHCPVLVVQ